MCPRHDVGTVDALSLGLQLLGLAVGREELRGRRRGLQLLAPGAEPIALGHGKERTLQAAKVVGSMASRSVTK